MRIISLFPKPIPKSLFEGLKDIAEIQYWEDLCEKDREQLDDVEVLISNPPISMQTDLLQRFPRLKMIASLGVGFDKFDLDEMKRRGIVLTNTPSATSDDVADFAWSLLTALSRQIPQAYVHACEKRRTFSGFPLTSRISGKRLGVAGLGHIGREIARRAEGFKMEIGYTNLSECDVAYQRFSNLKELAAWSDYLVLAMPGGATTHHIVNREILEALGSDSYLINIGRGELIDTEALIAALQNKTIAGAAIDVFEGEPSIDERLTHLNNLIITPHIASGTQEARESTGLQALENIKAFLASGTAPNRVV